MKTHRSLAYGMKLSQKVFSQKLLKMQVTLLNKFNSFDGDCYLKRIKRPFSGVAFLKWNWMLIPSISKAKRNYFGVSSLGTNDYRHGAKIRPNKLVLNGISEEVLKKKEHLCSGSQ